MKLNGRSSGKRRVFGKGVHRTSWACKHRRHRMKTALLTTILFWAGVSGLAFEQVQCGRNHAMLAPAESSAHRKYAPDREFDLLHLALDVTPDFKARSVAGQATIRFKPIAKPLEQLK